MLKNLIMVCGMIVALTLALHSIINSAIADSINPGVFSIDSTPYGKPYSNWTGEWWQWWLSNTATDNPAADPTGTNCAINQNGSVWMLAGTVGGSAERTCTIPAGKAILFPIIGSECSYAEYPAVRSDSELESCAQADNNAIDHLEATVDGTSLQQLEKYRILSPIFNMIYQDDNPLGAPPGPTKMVSDGYYVFLEPLSPGNHELHFVGTTLDNPTTGTSSFGVDVKYHLTVEP
jgi:hypothetical protein